MAAGIGLMSAVPYIAQTPGADQAAVARGGYLAAAAGCDECHTDSKNGGRPYAGGRRLATRFGFVVTTNITPDKETGIGRWSKRDFVQAMRWGIAPDGSHYVAAFPFPYFARLTDADLADLKAYLDSLPAVSRPVVEAATSIALFARARGAVGVALGSLGGRTAVAPLSDPQIVRGAYLAATVGRCGSCHTPLTWLGVPDKDRVFAGSPGGLRGEKAPNITPDRETGIGGWSEDEIAEALKTGETPDFELLGGAMAEVVRATARLTDADRMAIAAYLKSLPPKVFDKKR